MSKGYLHNIYGINEVFTLTASGEQTFDLNIKTLHNNMTVITEVTYDSIPATGGVTLTVADGTGDDDPAEVMLGGLLGVVGESSVYEIDTSGSTYTLNSDAATTKTKVLIVREEVGNKLRLSYTNENDTLTATIKVYGDF